ncbi:Short-chain dehydrogenase/reductase SDR [Lasiodiplodia theobromae]|uniref:Short-chain dehydrogenase/reductase SDR n=1 Tax=Lasiodiplodia theobromae TaxID=45133 RepID=UPI0015C2D1CA|nr:Short-chain dehydrogenase/reductase SDR [Lasiodiplodia theobromae]KAF4534484.1 Short-chain dehydrogenase/reductase SDR [Lasiodiplodia theobromae]
MASSGPRNALSKTTAAATTAARTTAHAATGTAHAAARALALAPTVALNAALSPSLTGLLLLVLTTRGGPSFVRDARARLERLLSGSGGSGGLRTAVEARRRLDRATDVLKVLFAVGLARVLNAVLNRWAMQQWRWKRPAVGLGGGAGRVAAREKNSPGLLWDFDGKRGVGEVVVVTGGCGGIGKEIVMGLVEGEKGGGRGVEGVKVVVLDVVDLPPELEGRANVVFYGCDLTSSSSIHETAAMVRADCGNPTVLINNAGVAQQHAILEGSDEYDEQLFRVNVLSHFTLIREFLPGMLAQKKGHIFTVASLSSFFTPSGIVNYAASKAAVLSLHEGLNVELRHRYGPAGKHIITSIIHPTWTQTPLMDSWIASLKKSRTLIREPAEVAKKIVRQVLRAEPAQVFVPESGALFSSFRGWPTWIQELLRDGADKKTRPLGDYDNSKGKGRASDVGYGVGEDREAFGNSRSYDIVEE